MNKNVFVALLLFPFLSIAQNQEIATFVSYNVLNYRNETSFCTNQNNSPIAKEGYMKTIFNYLDADLIACNEVGANPSHAVKILDRCLNVDGETKYQMAQFSSSSGSSLANAFYYNSEMFAVKSSDKILNEVNGDAIVRLIDVFELYYLDANLPLGADTTFLTVFIAHFKAGNSSSDAAQRARATDALMAYIENENVVGNYIISGDFNMYEASEVGFQNMVNPSNPLIKFVDPINRMGDWNNNSAYADVHTQSTHSTSNGCASGGGLDDRFDFVLISQDIEDDNNRMEYVSNSYKAIANDGNHFNGSIINPTNTSVPATVLDAIYNCSDHLPVLMDMILTEAAPNSVVSVIDDAIKVEFVNPSTNEIKGRILGEIGDYQVRVYSITGKMLLTSTVNNGVKKNFSLPLFHSGIVLVEVIAESGFKKVYKVVQN